MKSTKDKLKKVEPLNYKEFMFLRTDYQDHLMLKNSDYETVMRAKNDSEKLALLIKWAMDKDEQLEELIISLRAKGLYV